MVDASRARQPSLGFSSVADSAVRVWHARLRARCSPAFAQHQSTWLVFGAATSGEHERNATGWRRRDQTAGSIQECSAMSAEVSDRASSEPLELSPTTSSSRSQMCSPLNQRATRCTCRASQVERSYLRLGAATSSPAPATTPLSSSGERNRAAVAVPPSAFRRCP